MLADNKLITAEGVYEKPVDDWRNEIKRRGTQATLIN